MKEWFLWLLNRRTPQLPQELVDAQKKTDERQQRLESLEHERKFLEREHQRHSHDTD